MNGGGTAGDLRRQPGSRVDVALAAALALGSFLLYRHTQPAQVNLDGLGYVKQLAWNVNAGHLLYLPLLRAATALLHGEALAAGRLVDATAAALSVGLSYACARAFEDRRAALLAALGLALSYAVWVQGSDLECYAPALLSLMVLWALLLGFRAAPGVEATAAVGLALGVAVLTHITHVLAVPLVLGWMAQSRDERGRRRLPAALVAVAIGGAVAAAAYAWAGLVVRHLDGAGLVRWVLTAQHGFGYRGGALGRLADAAYGLSRALVWSPYLHESDAHALLGQFLLGLVALCVLVGAVVAAGRRGQLAHLPLAAVALWAMPYAAMALAFFGNDHERWLFVLPPLWLVGGAALARSARGTLAGALLVAGMGLANWTTAVEPAMRWTWDQTRADAATEPMRDGDLVIFPGHAWDEYVGFHSGRRVVPFPLAYYAGLLGEAGCADRLAREVRGARARGARVWALRLPLDGGGGDSGDHRGSGDGDERGLVELRQLGLGASRLRALLWRFRAVPVPTSQPAVTVFRLEDRAP